MTVAIPAAPGSGGFRRALNDSIALTVNWLRNNGELLLLMALVTAVFQPWNSRILPVTDFGTVLVERDTSASLGGQIVNIVQYYAGQGRFSPIINLEFVLGANVFGVWAQGWYWMYFVLNCSVILLAHSFLRTAGASRPVTLLVLALWATMVPTAETWIRPTGEPFALIFFLIALHAALNFADAPDWRRKALVMSACAAGIVFSKEVLVVLLPAGWLLSRLRLQEGRWTWAAWSRRDTFLVIVVGSVSALALIPTAYVALSAPSHNYAGLYGQSPDLWGAARHRMESALIPAVPRLHRLVNLRVDPGWTLLFALPSLLWIRIVLGGIVTARKRSIAWPLAVSGVWITMGLLAYAPWPINDDLYMMPFALGTMFGSALVLTALIGQSRSRLRATMMALAVLLAASSVEGRSVVYHRQLRTRLYASVIDSLVARGPVDLLIGATHEPVDGVRAWARTIEGYGIATRGLQVGTARDMSCSEARAELNSSSKAFVISTEWGCGKLAPGSIVVSQAVPLYQWPWLWERKLISARMFVVVPDRQRARLALSLDPASTTSKAKPR